MAEDPGVSTGASEQHSYFLAVEDDVVIGYYATTTYRLELNEVAVMYGVGKRAYPGTDRSSGRPCRPAGSWSWLQTADPRALSEIARASESVGFEVVVVHAIDAEAAAFYGRCGFREFADHPLHLFMTTKDLRRTLDE